MTTPLPTLSVAIAAYNESANIRQLLLSLVQQSRKNFKLQKILVATDGCTDSTVEIVSELHNKFPQISLLQGKSRKGKNYRLNQLFKKNTSDYLACFDADVQIKDNTFLSTLIQFAFTESAELVATTDIPAEPTTIIQSLATTWVNIWDASKHEYKKGNNIYSMTARSFLASKKLIQITQFPEGVADDHYLYLNAITNNLKFSWCRGAQVFYKIPSTLDDYVKQSVRFMHVNTTLPIYFGEEAVRSYYIPSNIKVKTIVSSIFHKPFATFGALLLHFYVRWQAAQMPIQVTSSWEILQSTK
ncbi:MAG: glycosyltransferase family 2 protein [Microgenomates group bacterium]